MRTPKRRSREEAFRSGLLSDAVYHPHGLMTSSSGSCPNCGTNCNSQYVLDTHPCTWNRASPYDYAPVANTSYTMTRLDERHNTMADVVICDLSGTIVTRGIAGYLTFATGPEAQPKAYVICPDCSEAVYDFLESLGNGSKPVMRAFDPEERARERGELELEPGPSQAQTTRDALDQEYGESSH